MTRTANSAWPEIKVELIAQLRRAQMRGAPWASEARADLEEHGPRSRIMRAIVTRVARKMAEDMEWSDPGRSRRNRLRSVT